MQHFYASMESYLHIHFSLIDTELVHLALLQEKKKFKSKCRPCCHSSAWKRLYNCNAMTNSYYCGSTKIIDQGPGSWERRWSGHHSNHFPVEGIGRLTAIFLFSPSTNMHLYNSSEKTQDYYYVFRRSILLAHTTSVNLSQPQESPAVGITTIFLAEGLLWLAGSQHSAELYDKGEERAGYNSSMHCHYPHL